MTTHPYQCKFCNKSFRREKTLSVHICTKKSRWGDRKTIGFKLGFRVFQTFYKLNTNSKAQKTEEEFINSNYYLDFVKFGKYLVELDPINPEDFIAFVMSNGVKIKDWRASYVYDTYLDQIIETELPERAIERTILVMEKWCKENNTMLSKFFETIDTNTATFLIRCGKISPWVLYFANKADNLFNRLNEEQGKIIQEAISPPKWEVQFLKRQEDVKFVQHFMEKSGI